MLLIELASVVIPMLLAEVVLVNLPLFGLSCGGCNSTLDLSSTPEADVIEAGLLATVLLVIVAAGTAVIRWVDDEVESVGGSRRGTTFGLRSSLGICWLIPLVCLTSYNTLCDNTRLFIVFSP